MRKTLSIIFGVLMIIGGIYCIAAPGITFLTIGYVVGVNMIFDGIGRIINWSQLRKESNSSVWVLISAILSLGFGVALLMSDILQLVLDVYIVYMIAIWLIILGALRIAHALRVKQARDVVETVKVDTQFGKSWWAAMILGVLLVVAGVVSLFAPATLAKVIGVVIGVSIIVAGANLVHFGTSSWMV